MAKVTAHELLQCLPPYEDEWVLVKDKQKVKDIIVLIEGVHERYAHLYDKIALYFDDNTVKKICENLYWFCIEYIQYDEEPEKMQTSGLPTGILTRQYGDCKHYASFCGGVLDAITRLTGKKIDWCYRFACYDPLRSTPHHVFVVVNDHGQPLWLDPTPEANDLTPLWWIDKKVKVQPMALYENIAGVNRKQYQGYFPGAGNNGFDFASLGRASLTLTPRINTPNPLTWNYQGHYPGIFDPYLGISQYRDEGGDRDLNEEQIAQQLNALIAQGPQPGHTVDGNFVRWVYETNLRSWNFYYAGGVRPGFDPSNVLPANYPRWIITADGRLTLSNDVALDDFKNPEIHLMTAWAQALINEYDPSPYPVKPQHVRRFSLMEEGNVDTRNMFTEARGDSIFKEVGKWLEDAVNVVKAGVLKIVGSIPRNAFLILVGVNAFNLAGSLYRNIQAGKWEDIADTWRSIGGNPDKLRNTIEDGAKKQITTNDQEVIGEPASIATFMAAAAPIIAVMLKFLDKDGKITEVLSATKTFLQTKYPDIDLSAYGFLDRRTGQEIQWVVDDRDNENYGGGNNQLPTNNQSNSFMNSPYIMPIGAGVAAALLLKKKGQKQPNLLMGLLAAVAAYFVLNRNNQGQLPAGTDKRAALLQWNQQNTGDTQATIQRVDALFRSMPQNEIDAVYDYIFNYAMKNIQLPQNSPLYQQISAISEKYQIFT